MILWPRTSRGCARTPGVSVAACVVGLVCYLLLPGVHAFHVHAEGPHVHHVHDDPGESHDPDKPEEPAGEPAHDAQACDVCQVFFGVRMGTDLPAPVAIWAPAPWVTETVALRLDAPVVATWAPDRRLRGPPC
jgi:hypothetical protein